MLRAERLREHYSHYQNHPSYPKNEFPMTRLSRILVWTSPDLCTQQRRMQIGKMPKHVCLFTCASTRAVHLEIMRRLTADAFLLAFRRFASRRGLPATLLSDNARTFKSVSKDIARIARAKEVVNYMANNGVTWTFIVEKTHGGAASGSAWFKPWSAR